MALFQIVIFRKDNELQCCHIKTKKEKIFNKPFSDWCIRCSGLSSSSNVKSWWWLTVHDHCQINWHRFRKLNPKVKWLQLENYNLATLILFEQIKLWMPNFEESNMGNSNKLLHSSYVKICLNFNLHKVCK